MATVASLRYARISPQKCRLVADQIRGKPVGQALHILQYSPKKAAHLVRKVLESAIANAENNDGADIDELSVGLSYRDVHQILPAHVKSQPSNFPVAILCSCFCFSLCSVSCGLIAL